MNKRGVRTLAMFEDVKMVLDAAVAAGGGTFTCETPGMATQWRQRAYKFRKMFRETVDKCIYDRLTLPAIPKDSCDVVIKVIEIKGTFTPASGAAPVKFDQPTTMTEDTDELMTDAMRFAQSLDGDVV